MFQQKNNQKQNEMAFSISEDYETQLNEAEERIIELEKELAEVKKVAASINTMPNSLTVENGAKALLCGEFNETIEVSNPEYCGCGKCDFCLEFPDTEESYIQKVPVTWVMIKDIYAKVVEHYYKK